MRNGIILSVLLILASCGVKTPQQKANKHIRKAFNHLEIAKRYDPNTSLTTTDTVTVPVIIEKSKIDSVFVSVPNDTVVIENEKLKIKYVKLFGDTVYIHGETKVDTVYMDIPVKKETFIKQESYKSAVKRILGINEFEFWLIHIILILITAGIIFINLQPGNIVDKVINLRK